MIEQILINVISAAVIHIIKQNLTTVKPEQEIKSENTEIINQTKDFILKNLTSSELLELKNYQNDPRFQEAITKYLIDNNAGSIITYFNNNLIPGDNQNKKAEIIVKIKNLFDQKILEQSQQPKNTELIKHSTEKIIPAKLDNLKALLLKVKEKDALIFQQLVALLKHEWEIFENEKMLFGQNGIDKRIIADIARLEGEIDNLIN
jgi:hypothetical protein